MAREHLARMIQSGLWIPHGKSYKGHENYCAKLVFEGTLRDIYGDECREDEPTFPEVANMASLQRYAGSNARWNNALLIRDFD